MFRWLANACSTAHLARGAARPVARPVAARAGFGGRRALARRPFAVHVWRYGLYAPPGLRDDEAAPLLVVLHGCRQRALGFAYAAGLTKLADRARLRLLCPQQRRLANLYRCWNWFIPQAQRGEGEIRVIRAMLDDVASRVPVQAGAVAAVGLSAGGALARCWHFTWATVSVRSSPWRPRRCWAATTCRTRAT